MPILLLLICLCLLIALPFLLTKPNRKRAGVEAFLTVNYAHRGLHDHASGLPENSMPAFARAVKQGYGIELDVQLTADGQVVVFHDSDLKRACQEQGKLAQMTYSDLQSLQIFNSQETIPLFSEVLSLVAGQVPLIVEIKAEEARVANLCQAVRALLADYRGSYCIESFNPLVLANFKKHAPHLIRGQLSGRFSDRKGLLYWLLRNLWLNSLSKPDFIAYEVGDDNNFWLKLLKKILPNTRHWLHHAKSF